MLIRLMVLALLLSGPVSHAGPSAPPELDIRYLQTQALRAPVEFFASAGDDPLPEADFAPLTEAEVHQLMAEGGRTFWLRVRLRNDDPTEPRSWVLRHQSPQIDRLTAFLLDEQGEPQRTRLTDRQPFHQRPLDYRTLALVHTTPAGSYTDVYLRLGYDRPGIASLDFTLSTEARFQSHARTEYYGFGAYFGMMLTLVLVTLALAWLLRQWNYLYLGLLLLGAALAWAMNSGLAFQFLWPEAVVWHNEGVHLVYLMGAACAIQFSRGFLKTPLLFPRSDRILLGAQLVLVAGAVAWLAGFYRPVFWLSHGALVALVVLAVLGYGAYRKGETFARWYLAAWLCYAYSLLVCLPGSGAALLAGGMPPLQFAQWLGALQALLLLMALSERLLGWDRERRQALRLANQDALTGLGNRRVMPEALDNFRNAFERTGLPVYLILIDLDHFRAINDSYGREAGDAVLQALAGLLTRICRPDDVCVRYGGGEFAILLQAPDQEVALDVANRIRREFAETPTRHHNRPITHTLTAGLTTVCSTAACIAGNQAIQEAAAALSEAKQAGRNRCQVFSGNAGSKPAQAWLPGSKP